MLKLKFIYKPKEFVAHGVLVSILLLQPTIAGAAGFSMLIRYGLHHSPLIRGAQANVHMESESKSIAWRSQFLPKAVFNLSDLYGAFDQPYDNGGGDFISNNGRDPSVGITVSYNLQNLFGPTSRVASLSYNYAQIERRIQKRALIRDIKTGFFAINEATNELNLIKNQIQLFNRVDRILDRQTQLGVFNEIESKQFDIQKGLLVSRLSAQRTTIAARYLSLASIMGMDVEDLKMKLRQIQSGPPLIFAERKNLNSVSLENLSQNDVLEGLQKNYDLAKTEYQHFTPATLPSVYARIHREWPTIPSYDGPQTIGEVGLVFPIDSLFTRPKERDRLAAQTEVEAANYDKALADYHSAVRLSILRIENLKHDAKNLRRVRKKAEQLLRKSFLFYAQKRLSALSTLDIFQKNFDASRALLLNGMETEITDANLEYLVGNPTP